MIVWVLRVHHFQQQVTDLPPIPKITTEELGELLNTKTLVESRLTIFFSNTNKICCQHSKQLKILRGIAERPEGWLTPGHEWPSLFFKKEHWDETESECEQQLNSEVHSINPQTEAQDELAGLVNPDAQPSHPPVVHT